MVSNEKDLKYNQQSSFEVLGQAVRPDWSHSAPADLPNQLWCLRFRPSISKACFRAPLRSSSPYCCVLLLDLCKYTAIAQLFRASIQSFSGLATPFVLV